MKTVVIRTAGMRNLYATLILSLLQAAFVLSTKESASLPKDTVTDVSTITASVSPAEESTVLPKNTLTDVSATTASVSPTGESTILSKDTLTDVPMIAASALSTEENTVLPKDAVIDVPSTSSTKPSTKPIIPLVLILLRSGYFVMPTEVLRIDWIGKDKLLGADTEFTTTLEDYKEDSLKLQTKFRTPPAESKPIDKKQIYLCAMGGFQKKYSKYGKQHDDQYCTFWTTFESKEVLTCEFEPEPFVEKVNVSDNPEKKQKYLPCGPENCGKMYRFVYKTTKINYRDSFEVYRFCYNEKNNEVIYTKHNITSVDLLFDDNLIYEREKKYPMVSDGYKYFGKKFQEIAQDYIELEKFQEQLKAEGDSTKIVYQAQKLAPDEDMEFALWRKTTFHYLNVRPMESQQAMLWNEINLRIRKSAIKQKDHRKYAFQTVVLTLDENQTKSPIMGKITSPDIWLKVINDTYPHVLVIPGIEDIIAYDGIAIVMNANYGNPAADAFFNNICEKNWCKKSLLGMFSEKLVKTVGCCPVTSTILDFFNSTMTIRNRLEIDQLVDENNDTMDIDHNISTEKRQQASEAEEYQPVEREEQGPSKKAKLE